MHCDYFENVRKSKKDGPRYRLITRQALKDHRRVLHEFFYNDAGDQNVFIKEAVKSVRRQFYSNSQINMVSDLNIKGNYNKDTINKIRTSLRLSQPTNVYMSKGDGFQANSCQFLQDTNNDNYPNTPLGNIPHPHHLSRRIYPEHGMLESRKNLHNLQDGLIKSQTSVKSRSTSNNADDNAKKRLLVKDHLIIPMVNKNQQSTDERRNSRDNFDQKVIRRDKTIEIAKKAALPSINTDSQMNVSKIKEDVDNKVLNRRFKGCQKTKVEMSVICQPISEEKRSINFFPEQFNQKQFLNKSRISKAKLREVRSRKNYRVKMRWRLTELARGHRLRKFKTLMHCVNEINDRLEPKKRDLGSSHKTPKRVSKRPRSTEDIVHYSTFLNQTIMAFDPLRLEFAVQRVIEAAPKSRSSTNHQITTRCPIIVRSYFRLDSFVISDVTIERTHTRLHLALFTEALKILEPTRELSIYDREVVTLRPRIHQHSWYENLSKLTRQKVKIVNSKVTCWNEISEPNSDTSLSSKDYNNRSCDSLCNTNDVYGSDSDTGATVELSPDLESFLGMHRILSCEQTTEKCKVHKQVNPKVHKVIQEVNVANSTSMTIFVAPRTTARTRFRCALLQDVDISEDIAQSHRNMSGMLDNCMERSMCLLMPRCLYEIVSDDPLNVYLESHEPYTIVDHLCMVKTYIFRKRTQRFIFDQQNICIENDKIVYHSTKALLNGVTVSI